MKINIENGLRQMRQYIPEDVGAYHHALDALVANLKELRDHTRKGDMTAVAEFFETYTFNDTGKEGEKNGPE